MLAKPKIRKPVTADVCMLKATVEAARSATSLTEVRLLAVCFVVFARFMHCEELIKLKCENATFKAESMVIRIVYSEQYWEGSSSVIDCTGEVTCPVGMMEKYFSGTHI